MVERNKNHNTFERVARVLAEVLQVPLERVTPDARFREDLGADSLDLVEIIMALEREFDADVLRHIDGSWMELLEARSSQVTTVGQAVEWLELLAPLCCTRSLATDPALRERELEFRTELWYSPKPQERILALALQGDLDHGDVGWLA